jgi:hypothetical protein
MKILLVCKCRCLFDPDTRDPGWVKKIRIRIWDEQPGPYFRELKNNFFGVKILKFFYGGWKKFVSRINIPDPQHCMFAWLLIRILLLPMDLISASMYC